MIQYAGVLLGLWFVYRSWVRQRTAMQRARYLEVRYKTFRLREKLVKMALQGVIDEERCARLYDSLNWAVRYINELPFFVIRGFAESARRVGISADTVEFEKELAEAPEELKEWYTEFTKLLCDAVGLFTPLGYLSRWAKISVLKPICYIWFFCWFSHMLVRLSDHPLQRIKVTHTRIPEHIKNIREVEAVGREIQSSARRFHERLAAHA